MRTKLKDNQVLHLLSTGEKAMAKEIIIVKMIGMGASVIAYEATDPTRQIHYVLKECYPENGAARLADGTICWKDSDIETKAKSRMRRAYEMQLALQNESSTENTSTHLVDTIFEGNNTLYTITDHQNATTYNILDDKTLLETFITARSIAKALKAYHDNGYLHLDVKPQNIMIMPETRDMVLLLDFDSITRMDAVAESILSYSPNYAAPEQLQGRVSKICAATDVYAVGAIVFQRVFSRLPGLEDQSIYSVWDYSSNPLFEKLSMTVQRLTTEFFRKTLSASVKNRYQTMDEVIAALDVLVEESNPKKRFILDAPPVCFNTFVGRTAELEEIHKKLRGNKPVFITGMKGIGKTELARNYARTYRNDYDVIRFAEYEGSLKDLIVSGNLVKIENDSDENLSIDSFAGLVDERTLLIIDNYHTEDVSTSDDELFDELASLKSKLLITTYENAQDIYETSEWIELEELSFAEQYSLFEEEYGEALSDHEATLTKQILKEISGYTLLIPLIAKLLKNSSLSFEDLFQAILETGTSDIPGKVRHKKDSSVYKASVGDIVRKVLDLSSLSEKEHYVLNCLTALKGIRVRRAKLIEWIGSQYDDAIADLSRKHWINIEGIGSSAYVSIHDVIRDVVLHDETQPHDFTWAQAIIDEYIKDVDNTHFMWPEHPYSYPELLGRNRVRLLSSPEDLTIIHNNPMLKLINTLLRTIDIQHEPERLINNLYSIIKWDLNRVYNCCPDCDDLLKAIETTEVCNALSAQSIFNLHVARLFLSLKTLCECDLSAPREECEVLDLCRKTIRHAEWIIGFIGKHAKRKTAFNVSYAVLHRALLLAGYSLGIHLFTTHHPLFSSTALNEYTDFVKQEAQYIKEKYPDLIPKDVKPYNYSFDSDLDYFYSCMDPNCEKQLQDEYNEIEYLISQNETEAEESFQKEAIDNYRRIVIEDFGPGGLEQLEQEEKIATLLYESQKLVEQCEQAGYTEVETPSEHPEISVKHLTDDATLKKTAELLSLAKEKYETAHNLADKCEVIYPDHPGAPSRDFRYIHHQWLAAACIHACCSGDFSAAKQYYSDFLKTDIIGFGLFLSRLGCPNMKMYNTLKYLGFTEMCAEILQLNIQYLGNDVIASKKMKYNQDNDFLKPGLDELIHASSTLLEYSEVLGDEKLVKKYTKMVEKYNEMKAQLEDPGFEFEA